MVQFLLLINRTIKLNDIDCSIDQHSHVVDCRIARLDGCLRNRSCSAWNLGDFVELTQPYSGVVATSRCGQDTTKRRYQSHVVDPQHYKYAAGQRPTHWECVIFNGEQAYPEFLVQYTVL